MEKDLFGALLSYLDKNNLEYSIDKVELFCDHENKMSIRKWDYPIEKPTINTLKMETVKDIQDAKERKNIKQNMNMSKIMVVNRIPQMTPSEGCMVFNKQTNSLMIYANDEWKSFTSV